MTASETACTIRVFLMFPSWFECFGSASPRMRCRAHSSKAQILSREYRLCHLLVNHDFARHIDGCEVGYRLTRSHPGAAQFGGRKTQGRPCFSHDSGWTAKAPTSSHA